MPENTQSLLNVETALWYRLVPQDFVTYSFNLDIILPPVMMEQTVVEIPVR